MSAPTLSVAMCTYNGADYLAEQLRSIREQSLPPDEVIVSDDGSTDDTARIVGEFARTVPFVVRFVPQPVNLGVSRNFAAALALCRGEVIALCDQDDFWLPEKLRTGMDFLRSHPDCWLLFTDAVVTGDDLRPHPAAASLWQHVAFSAARRDTLSDPATALRTLADGNCVTGATVLLRRELLPHALPLPERLPETMIHDGWFAAVAAALGRLACLDERTILYRQHARQQAGLIPTASSRRPGRLPRKLFAALADYHGKLHAALAQRVAAQALPGTLEELRTRAAHFRLRADLPPARWRRLGPILQEWRRRGYRRFVRHPLLAALRDTVAF